MSLKQQRKNIRIEIDSMVSMFPKLKLGSYSIIEAQHESGYTPIPEHYQAYFYEKEKMEEFELAQLADFFRLELQKGRFYTLTKENVEINIKKHTDKSPWRKIKDMFK